MRSLWIVAFCLVAACGRASSGGKNGAEPSPEVASDEDSEAPLSYYFDDKGKLPACDERHESALAYVASEKVFYACQSGSWEPVDIRGEKGEKGDPGAAVDPNEQQGETELFLVLDKDLRLIGYASGDTSTSSNVVRLATGGTKAVVSGSTILPEGICYFQTGDCSSTCYLASEKSGQTNTTSVCPVGAGYLTTGIANPFRSRFQGGLCVPMTLADPLPETTHGTRKFMAGDCQSFTAPFTVSKAQQ